MNGLAVADVFDEAAAVIQRNGWHQGDMFDRAKSAPPEQCPVCPWGALAIVIVGTPVLHTNADLRAVKPYAETLAAFLKLPGSSSMWSVPNWNDKPDRTADEVVAALRDAARTERERTAAPA